MNQVQPNVDVKVTQVVIGLFKLSNMKKLKNIFEKYFSPYGTCPKRKNKEKRMEPKKEELN